jgi:hypothetical protein
MIRYAQIPEENLAIQAGLPAFTKELTREVVRDTAQEVALDAESKPIDFMHLVADLEAYFDGSLQNFIDAAREGFDAALEELANTGQNGSEKKVAEREGGREQDGDDDEGEDSGDDEEEEQEEDAPSTPNKRPRRSPQAAPPPPPPPPPQPVREENEDDEGLRPVAVPPTAAVRPAISSPPQQRGAVVAVAESPAPSEAAGLESAAKRQRTEGSVAPDYADPQRWSQHPLPPPAGTEGFARLSRFGRVEGRHYDGGVAVHLVGPLPAMGSDGLAPTLLREVTKLRTIMYPGLQALRELAVGDSVAEVAFVFTEELRMQHVAYVAKLDSAQIKCIGRAVAAALYHLHSVGLSHRNVCVENVIYGSDGTVKLADWYWCDSLPSDAVRLAAAPERIFMSVPTRELQEPADLWSLGVVMASLLLGRPLITGATLQDQRWNTEVLLGSPLERDWKVCFFLSLLLLI